MRVARIEQLIIIAGILSLSFGEFQKNKIRKTIENNPCEPQLWYKERDNFVCVEYCPRTDPALPFLNMENKECVSECDKTSSFSKNYFFTCVNSCPKSTIEYNNECLPLILAQISPGFLNDLAKFYQKFQSGLFEKVSYEMYKYTLKNQAPELLYKSLFPSDFPISRCELGTTKDFILRKLAIKEFLFMKLDIIREDQIANQVEYEFFTAYGEKIDLIFPKGNRIIISNKIYSTKIEEAGINIAREFSDTGINIYNSEEPFFNDVCFQFTTKNKTDISLKDRRKYIFQNVSFCEEGCVLDKLNLLTLEFECSCIIKPMLSLNQKNFIRNEESSSFRKIKNFGKFRSFKCLSYFSSRNLKQSSVLICLLLCIFQCISLGFLVFLGIKSIERDFRENLEDKDGKETPKRGGILTTKLQKKSLVRDVIVIAPAFQSHKNFSLGLKKYSNTSKKIIIPPIDLSKIEQLKNFQNQTISTQSNLIQIKKTRKNEEIQNHLKNINEIKEGGNFNLAKTPSNISQYFEVSHEFSDKYNLPEVKNSSSYDEDEMNRMKYEKALLFDKRKFCQVYYCFIKIKHPVLYTFAHKTKFVPKVVKISLLLFRFLLYIGLSSLFYSGRYLTYQFLHQGKYSFFFHLKKNILVTLLCSVIAYLLQFLFESEKFIIKISSLKNKEEIKVRKKKFVFFFKLKTLILVFLQGIYMACIVIYICIFSIVYINTQNNIVIDTLIVFLISYIYPLFFCLISALLRHIGIKKKVRSLYIFSKFFFFL